MEIRLTGRRNAMNREYCYALKYANQTIVQLFAFWHFESKWSGTFAISFSCRYEFISMELTTSNRIVIAFQFTLWLQNFISSFCFRWLSLNHTLLTVHTQTCRIYWTRNTKHITKQQQKTNQRIYFSIKYFMCTTFTEFFCLVNLCNWSSLLVYFVGFVSGSKVKFF